MCISVLKRQITSFEEIALEKIYLNNTKQNLAKNLLLLQLLLKGTSIFTTAWSLRSNSKQMIWSDLWLQGHSYMYFRNSAHTGFTALKFCRILSSEPCPSYQGSPTLLLLHSFFEDVKAEPTSFQWEGSDWWSPPSLHFPSIWIFICVYI